MITYDHLWWIKSTYDGWRRLKMLFWRKPALTPTKNYENKTVCVFFQGASDGNARISRNISQKSKNNEKLNFQKNRFFENSNFHQDRCPDVFFGGFHPWNTPKIFQNPMYSHFSKIKIFLFMMNSWFCWPMLINFKIFLILQTFVFYMRRTLVETFWDDACRRTHPWELWKGLSTVIKTKQIHN